jgi:hypothetical protein
MATVDEQVAEIMARCKEAGLDLNSPAYRTARQWKTFFEAPIDGSFFLVTNFIFNKEPVSGIGGAEIVKGIRARQDALGIKYLADGKVMGTINGPEETTPWQTCGVLEFPDKEAFVQLFLGDLEMQRRRSEYITLYRSVLVNNEKRMA